MTLKHKHIITLIQLSIAAVYILFGLHKLIGGSPAEEVIFSAITFVDLEWFYPFLGISEVLIGLSFLHRGFFRKIGFWFFMAHMGGTFLPFITAPDLCFGTCPIQGHPTITIVGQYIIKNLPLIGCGLLLKFIQDDSAQ